MTKEQKQTTGQRLETLLNALGWKKTAFADHAKIDRSMFSHLCRDKRPLLPNMAERIANATGARVEWLLTGDGDMLEPPPTISAYEAARDAGASEFAAGIFARYVALDEKERETFERVLQTVFSTGLDAFKQQAIAAITRIQTNGGAGSIVQIIGDNNQNNTLG